MSVDLSLGEMPGHLIRRLNQHSTAVFQDRIKAAGTELTPVQFSALTILAHHPGIDQASLAELIAYDRATIGGVVKRLEQKSLLRREPNKGDRRAFSLTLTAAGEALLGRSTPLVVSLQDDILAGLTPSERATLIQLCRKALQHAAAGTASLDLPRKAAPHIDSE